MDLCWQVANCLSFPCVKAESGSFGQALSTAMPLITDSFGLVVDNSHALLLHGSICDNEKAPMFGCKDGLITMWLPGWGMVLASCFFQAFAAWLRFVWLSFKPVWLRLRICLHPSAVVVICMWICQASMCCMVEGRVVFTERFPKESTSLTLAFLEHH